jgi:flagellin
MSLSVHTNLSALVAQKSQNKASGNLQQSMMRLSTGLRINSAKDDAAGVGISSRLGVQERALTQAKRNTTDGLAVIAGLDGLTSSIEDMLGRMKELAVQAKTGTYTAGDRDNADAEFQALVSEITAVADRQINGIDQNGVITSLTIQIGAKATEILDVTITDIDATALGVGAAEISTVALASAAIDLIDTAITSVATARGSLGSSMNRMEQITISLDNQIQGTASVLGSIQDTDFASETTKLTKNQILQQASTAMLAQANQLPQAALSLLG